MFQQIFEWMQNNTLLVVFILIVTSIVIYQSFEYYRKRQKPQTQTNFSQVEINKNNYLLKMLEYTETEIEKLKDEYTVSRNRYDEYNELVQKMNVLQNNIVELTNYKQILTKQIRGTIHWKL